MYLIENITVHGCAGIWNFYLSFQLVILLVSAAKTKFIFQQENMLPSLMVLNTEQVRCELLIGDLIWLFSALVDNPIALQFVQ